MAITYQYTGPTNAGYYSTILPALQSASNATGSPLGLLEAMTMQESTWGSQKWPEYLSMEPYKGYPSVVNTSAITSVYGQALAAAQYLTYLARMTGGYTNGANAYNCGPSAYANCGYVNTMIARGHLRVAVAQAAVAVVIAPSFGVSGSASVDAGGHILGTLRLVASHGNIPYRVTMSVAPSYNTSYPLSTTATGTAYSGQTTNVNQSLLAPIPSEEIIRGYQQLHSGPVAFAYTVNWTVADPNTGQTKNVSGGQRVTLTVQ